MPVPPPPGIDVENSKTMDPVKMAPKREVPGRVGLPGDPGTP